jgi:Tol biopolymer transport system component
MKRLVVLGALVVACSLVAAASTLPATPTALLTYAVTAGGPERGGLCVARPDGTQRLRLTHGAEDRTPAWSPNGRYVAFSRRVAGEQASRIVVADARGRVVRQFGSGLVSAEPAWSPDGERIAYSAGSAGSSRIVVASVLGHTLVTLATRAASASSPTWSPDGSRIAYVERLDTDDEGETGLTRIAVVAADGTGRRILATRAGEPAWSPDGSEIAYVAYATRWRETGDIVVAAVSSGNQRRLTATPTLEGRPAWSPDGKLLAFARGSQSESAIVVTRRDGSGERVVVQSATYGALDPAWRPPAALRATLRRACP